MMTKVVKLQNQELGHNIDTKSNSSLLAWYKSGDSNAGPIK